VLLLAFASCFCVGVGGGLQTAKDLTHLLQSLEGLFYRGINEKGKALLKAPQIENGSSYEGEAHKKQSESYSLVKNPLEATVA
jgi:hypothetical protein